MSHLRTTSSFVVYFAYLYLVKQLKCERLVAL